MRRLNKTNRLGLIRCVVLLISKIGLTGCVVFLINRMGITRFVDLLCQLMILLEGLARRKSNIKEQMKLWMQSQ